MKKHLLLASLLISSTINFAQNFEWATSLGGTSNDYGYSVAVDASGNVYNTGTFEGTADFDPGVGTFTLTSAGAADIFISKLDANGNFVWAKGIGGTTNDYGLTVAVDASGNVYTTGSFQGTADFDPEVGNFPLTSAGAADIFISKLDANGNFVWAKSMGGTLADKCSGIKIDATGNLFITGSFKGTADFDPEVGTFPLTSAGAADIFLSKLDINGNFVWAKSMGGTLADKCSGIKIDATGNLFITGSFKGTADFDPEAGIFNLTSAGGDDIFVSKLDASGNLVWAKSIGGTSADASQAIAIDATGNVYTSGYFSGAVDFDPGAATYSFTSSIYDAFISKLDVNGDFVWAKHMVGGGDVAQAIAVDAAGNIYTTGYTQGTTDYDPGVGTFSLTSAGAFDVFISKLDANGDFVWAKRMGASSNEAGLGITVDATGNVYTTGYFGDTVDFDPGADTSTLVAPAGSYSIFISKLDALGNFVSAQSIGNSNGTCVSYSIALDAANNIYTTGYYASTTDFDPNAGVFNLTAQGNYDVFVLKLSPSPVGIAETNNELMTMLYPNPTNALLSIKTDGEIQEISIYNSLGVLIQTEKTNAFSVEQLASGFYTVAIKTSTGTSLDRFVKQ